MYGYEITQRVKERTKEQITLTEGALYPTLHKLEAEGLVSVEKVNVGRWVRKYYRLTQAGDTATTTKLREFVVHTRVLAINSELKIWRILIFHTEGHGGFSQRCCVIKEQSNLLMKFAYPKQGHRNLALRAKKTRTRTHSDELFNL